MPQDLVSQFDRKYALPIETYRQVLTITLRNAIPDAVRWEGMMVYVLSEGASFVLTGGIDNTHWVNFGEIVDVEVVDNLLSTSATDALSANQGRELKDLIDNITVGVDWGDIGGTLSDQTDLQSALNAKQNTITGGASTIVSSNLTANRALVSNGSGKVAVSSVTSTELGYLDGVTSAIQTQLNSKANSSDLSNYVPTSRTISAGTGLTGGGNLSANRSFALSAGSIASLGLADTAVQPSDLSSYVPTSRTLTGGDGIGTIGNLSANRTIAVDNTVIRTTGNQSMTGTKEFIDELYFKTNSRVIGSASGVTNVSYIGFFENNKTTRQGYVGYPSPSNSHLYLRNDIGSTFLLLHSDAIANGLIYNYGSGDKFVYHSGNFAPSDYTPITRTLTAGDGLTGGGNLSANRSFAVDGTVVRTSGNQTIGGVKTFSSNLIGQGTATFTGNITAGSDIRLKKNIKPITNALDKIDTLTGSIWERKDNGERQTGLIAQTLRKVLPEAVMEADDDMKTLSIAYGNVVGLLVEGIKELRKEVNQLKEQINGI